MSARIVAAFAVALALVAPAQTAEPEQFGTGVSLTETTPIASLVANPKAFEGRTVRVEGTVQAVCQEMGCWMALASDTGDKGTPLFVKVEEGVVRLPVRAKGRRAAAQGVAQRIGGERDAREAAHEFAEATGGHAHAEAAEMWQLKATGALVY